MAFSSSLSFATRAISISLFFLISIFSFTNSSIITPSNPTNNPIPTPWPDQFHSILVMNKSGKHQIVDLWYDFTHGRNLNIIRKQLIGEVVYNLEWNNGTLFYYTLDSRRKCKVMKSGVGFLRPNFLEDATYLGQQKADGFLCNVWEKVDFIRYYEDVVTKKPIHWVFLQSGQEAHVMSFAVGEVFPEEKWQAPAYCFKKIEEDDNPKFGVKSISDFKVSSIN